MFACRRPGSRQILCCRFSCTRHTGFLTAEMDDEDDLFIVTRWGLYWDHYLRWPWPKMLVYCTQPSHNITKHKAELPRELSLKQFPAIFLFLLGAPHNISKFGPVRIELSEVVAPSSTLLAARFTPKCLCETTCRCRGRDDGSRMFVISPPCFQK